MVPLSANGDCSVVQVGILTDWFKAWNECEQTVALLSLLKRVSRTQARFLHICLEHWLADCTEIHVLEAEANNAGTTDTDTDIVIHKQAYTYTGTQTHRRTHTH